MLSVGAVGQCNCRRSGGRTTALEIIFIAANLGHESFHINEDSFNARVRS